MGSDCRSISSIPYTGRVTRKSCKLLPSIFQGALFPRDTQYSQNHSQRASFIPDAEPNASRYCSPNVPHYASHASSIPLKPHLIGLVENGTPHSFLPQRPNMN
jgi:hypothetical protein